MSEFTDTTANAMAISMAYMQANHVVYQGQEFWGVCSEKESQTLAIGGFESHFVGAFRVEKAGFPIPVKGSRIILGETERRIGDIAQDPISWTLYLEDVTR
jgi:hypothetical protein